MSTTKSNELLAWAREVRALYDELARPIEMLADDRLWALEESWPTFSRDDWEPSELGLHYFNQIGVQQLPACPLPAPAWAESYELDLIDWPRTLGVEFQGKQWVTGDGLQWARLSAHYFIAVDGYTEGDDVRTPGEAWAGDAGVEFCYPEPYRADGTPKQTRGYMTLDGAFQLELALGDALNVLREGVEA